MFYVLYMLAVVIDAVFPLQKLTTTLRLKNWEKTSDGDVMTRFQYADGQHQITASPNGWTRMEGSHLWTASGMYVSLLTIAQLGISWAGSW